MVLRPGGPGAGLLAVPGEDPQDPGTAMSEPTTVHVDVDYDREAGEIHLTGKGVGPIPYSITCAVETPEAAAYQFTMFVTTYRVSGCEVVLQNGKRLGPLPGFSDEEEVVMP